MKFRIYIIIAILAAGLSYTLDCLTHPQEKENAITARQHEDTLKGNGETSDRYVDYNYAFCAASGTSISAQRSNSNSSIPIWLPYMSSRDTAIDTELLRVTADSMSARPP